jgi:hypothetical protein
VKTARAVRFGQSPRGNRQFRVPCGCKVEILPVKTGDGIDVHYCDVHGEAQGLLESLQEFNALAGDHLSPEIARKARAVIARARGEI